MFIAANTRWPAVIVYFETVFLILPSAYKAGFPRSSQKYTLLVTTHFQSMYVFVYLSMLALCM